MKLSIIGSIAAGVLGCSLCGCILYGRGNAEGSSPASKESADPLAIYKSEFAIQEIDSTLMQRIMGKGRSYPPGAEKLMPLDSLRYLTLSYYDFEGNPQTGGELICHKAIAEDMLEIFEELFDSCYQFKRIELVDNYDADDRKSMEADNTSCFNFRVVAGTTSLSNHARGLAIDVNPLDNPYVKGDYVSPPNGKDFAFNRVKKRASGDPKYSHVITEDDLCYKVFTKHGFFWGGHWKSIKDYQHFEKPDAVKK